VNGTVAYAPSILHKDATLINGLKLRRMTSERIERTFTAKASLFSLPNIKNTISTKQETIDELPKEVPSMNFQMELANHSVMDQSMVQMRAPFIKKSEILNNLSFESCDHNIFNPNYSSEEEINSDIEEEETDETYDQFQLNDTSSMRDPYNLRQCYTPQEIYGQNNNTMGDNSSKLSNMYQFRGNTSSIQYVNDSRSID
jgi:hypothetical protein